MRLALVGGLVAAFCVGFGLFLVAISDLGLAASLLGLFAGGFALVSTAHLANRHRRALRREWICLVGMQQISDALELRDGESAIGALLEWDRTYSHEVDMQDAHSVARFWKLPPELGEDWK